MAYDIYVGATFPGAGHVMSVKEHVFDRFVEAHSGLVPRFSLVARMRDPYGDADYLPSETSNLARELLELERVCANPEVCKLCKALREIATTANAQGASIFCRGD